MKISTSFDIQVIVNGIPFPSDSIEGWRWLNKIVEDAHAVKASPVFTVSGSITPTPAPRAGSGDNPVVSTPPEDVGTYHNPVERAWRAIGRPATAEEILEQMIAQGYKTRSLSPLDATKRAIRGNSRFVRVVPPRNNKPSLWALRGVSTSSPPDSEPDVVAGNTAYQVKTTSADYARAALKQLGKPSPVNEIVEVMKAKGWETRSETAEKMGKTAHEVMRRDGGFRFYGQGVWGLKEWPAPVNPFTSLLPAMSDDEGTEDDYEPGQPDNGTGE